MWSVVVGMLAVAVPAVPPQAEHAAFLREVAAPSFRKVNSSLSRFEVVHTRAMDRGRTIVLVRAGLGAAPHRWPPDTIWWDRDELLGVFVLGPARPERARVLAILDNPDADSKAWMERVSPRSVVLGRQGAFYGGRLRYVKLWFDPESDGPARTYRYYPVPITRILTLGGALHFVANTGGRLVVLRESEGRPVRAAGTKTEPILARLQDFDAHLGVQGADPSAPPAVPRWIPPRPTGARIPLDANGRFHLAPRGAGAAPYNTIAEKVGRGYELHPLPQSSYDEFRRARSGRARGGYRREHTRIAEEIGPHQMVAGRLWFGKTFYDGEGFNGVGGLGYFDTVAHRFRIFAPAEIVDWSVSALLVEGNVAWAGLARYCEGNCSPGGLLRFDVETGRAAVYRLVQQAVQIVRWKDDLYVATDNGLAILRGGRFERYVLEPDVAGQIVVIPAS